MKIVTVDSYLAALPEEQRNTIAAVRKTILENLPDGYEESMGWGMLTWSIPLSRYPETYNKQPLAYAALAAQKNYNAIYLNSVYQDPVLEKELREGYSKAGKKLDMGKSCIRFKTLSDLPLEVIGKVIASTTPEQFIARYEEARTGNSRGE